MKIIFLSISTISQKDSQHQISQLLKSLLKYEDEKNQILDLFLTNFKKTKIQDFSTNSRIASVQFLTTISLNLNENLLKEVYQQLISISIISFQRDDKLKMKLFIKSKISRKLQCFIRQNSV